VVLLSPAAPSYGRFRNFEHRSDVFARAVRDSA
jgi:UDP-N-acetylmuramoylalanine-D-glutamate ligase